MNKPVVRYTEVYFDSVVVGGRAVVMPIDHPKRSNRNPVMTSTVIKLTDSGFETLNTRYVCV